MRGTAGLGSTDTGQWLAVARQSPQASFFHTPYWSEIAYCMYPAGADVSQTITLRDGTTVIYPLFKLDASEAASPVLSAFAGCYGGPIAPRLLSPVEIAQLHAMVSRRRLGGRLLITLGPAMPSARVPPGFARADDFTHVLALAGRAFEDLVAGFQQAKRRQYRRGRRMGVELVAAEHAADIGDYFRIYEEALARRGGRASSRYPRALYDRLGELSRQHPDLVRLWFSELEGERVAGAWVFYWNGSAVLWDAAARDVGSAQFSPVASLYADIARDALERGCHGFDLNPSGGHQTAAELKRRLGAERQTVARLEWVHRRPAARARAAAGRLLARRAGI